MDNGKISEFICEYSLLQSKIDAYIYYFISETLII